MQIFFFDIHGYLLILMIFSCHGERYWWYFLCPTPSFRSRSCVWQKGLDIPAVGRGQTPVFGEIPNDLMLRRRKSNDFLGKIFFLTLAFMSSRDRNDQWLINHNGKRYPTVCTSDRQNNRNSHLWPPQTKKVGHSQPQTQVIENCRKVWKRESRCGVIWCF